ncbi:unnamed protein product (macronuclear) [Paramecium tetraurelia]|uniref:Uncharacterized protein n=1 Tax=Paramecium tetraurelia TaxID=5888 RepID=A0C2R5_PARTE|nr:uncharacterized protein GSPATT00034560001 [Paramecium tetraurelia]CAK65082.1 unnamed protein product [Paramecium tetraurelia]|eukprot:XP_001432479.1 hypothetical protein (macronuclear) [Paramecium tetraurelia strain d4-2]
MDQTNHQVLELKMEFLTCMKNSKYQEAHVIIQKSKIIMIMRVLKIDPNNPLIGKCNKFLTEFKTKLEEKEKELKEEEEEEEEEEQQQADDDESDGVDPNDVPDLEEELGIQHNEAEIQERKKRLFQLLQNVDAGDKEAVLDAIRKSKQQG